MQEVMMIRRLPAGGYTTALSVSASYFSKKQGRVLTLIRPGFPKEVLDNDKEWQQFMKIKEIHVAH
jgi:hypothetical protein